MRFAIPALVAAVFVMSGIGPVAAADSEVTVRAGRTTMVFNGATYNKSTCHARMIPDFKVRRKPRHGKVAFRTVMTRVGPDSGKCNGTRIKGAAVYFTPDRGFRGTDDFVVGFSYFSRDGGRRMKHRAHSVRLTVK